MRKPIKLWLEALRSGKYKQGKSYLKKEGRYCCLGVAIEVYNKSHTHKQKVQFPDHSLLQFLGVIPDLIKTRHWLKLYSSCGTIGNDESSLATMNDSGKSFRQIADFIEKNINGLFKK